VLAIFKKKRYSLNKMKNGNTNNENNEIKKVEIGACVFQEERV